MTELLHCFLLSLFIGVTSGGSQIILNASSVDITEGVTKDLTLGCFVKKTDTSDDDSTTKSTSPYDISRVESIIITKDSTQTIARIILGQVAQTFPAAGNDATSTGSLLSDSEASLFLGVYWPSAGQNQSGSYNCKVSATDLNGENIKLETNVNIKFILPTIGELISRINNLEEGLKENKEAQIKQVAETKSTIRDLKTVIGMSKSLHVEQGVINFAPSYSWTEIAGRKLNFQKNRFNAPYERPPMIIISIERVDLDHKFNSRYRVDIENITTTGFDIRGELFWDSVIWELSGHWTSIGV